jgi:hypothetical protein
MIVTRRKTHLSSRMALILLAVALLAGCVSSPVLLRGASIVNASGGDIHDVRVRHQPTRRIAMAGTIIKDSAFDLGFEGQPLLGEHAIMTWTDRNGQKQSRRLVIPKSHDSEAEAMQLLYRIGEVGNVSVSLVP